LTRDSACRCQCR